jgi:hypothetical protein
MVFEQAFKNIDDILHKDAGCTSELDYTEQSSWLLFLKYLDALELDKATEAADTFLNAIADMEERLSFKAFTLGGALTREQKNSLLDLLMTQIAIRIKEMGPEVMEEKNITSSVDEGDELVEAQDFVLWLHATNEKPAPPEAEEPFPHFDPKADVVAPRMQVVESDENGPLVVQETNVAVE